MLLSWCCVVVCVWCSVVECRVVLCGVVLNVVLCCVLFRYVGVGVGVGVGDNEYGVSCCVILCCDVLYSDLPLELCVAVSVLCALCSMLYALCCCVACCVLICASFGCSFSLPFYPHVTQPRQTASRSRFFFCLINAYV